MRILVASDAGLRVVRWIEGERTGAVVAKHFEGESVSSVAARDGVIFAAVPGRGLHRSDDGGASWDMVADQFSGAGARTVSAGRSGELVVGTEPPGLHLSRDGGESWTELTGFAALDATEHWKPYGGKEAHVEAITFDRHDTNRLYAGVEIGGVYRSDDAGATWAGINEGIFDDIHDLLVDPRNGSRIFAATGGGLYASPDRGASWRAVPGDIAGRYCTRFYAAGTTSLTSPSESYFLVGSAGGPSSGWGKNASKADAQVWASYDSGRTWEVKPPHKTRDASPITAFAGAPRSPDTVLVGSAGGHLLHGTLEADRWQQIQYGLGRVRSLLVL